MFSHLSTHVLFISVSIGFLLISAWPIRCHSIMRLNATWLITSSYLSTNLLFMSVSVGFSLMFAWLSHCHSGMKRYVAQGIVCAISKSRTFPYECLLNGFKPLFHSTGPEVQTFRYGIYKPSSSPGKWSIQADTRTTTKPSSHTRGTSKSRDYFYLYRFAQAHTRPVAH